MTDQASAQARLQAAVEADRQRLARGERPTYHVRSTASVFGGLDVTIEELPLVHLFVPDATGVIDGARLLIARTLDCDPHAFEIGTGN